MTIIEKLKKKCGELQEEVNDLNRVIEKLEDEPRIIKYIEGILDKKVSSKPQIEKPKTKTFAELIKSSD